MHPSLLSFCSNVIRQSPSLNVYATCRSACSPVLPVRCECGAAFLCVKQCTAGQFNYHGTDILQRQHCEVKPNQVMELHKLHIPAVARQLHQAPMPVIRFFSLRPRLPELLNDMPAGRRLTPLVNQCRQQTLPLRHQAASLLNNTPAVAHAAEHDLHINYKHRSLKAGRRECMIISCLCKSRVDVPCCEHPVHTDTGWCAQQLSLQGANASYGCEFQIWDVHLARLKCGRCLADQKRTRRRRAPSK